MQLPALGGGNPQVNALGSFQEGQAQAAGIDRVRQQNAIQAMQTIGSVALGAMGGNLNGQVNAERFNQGLDYLSKMGIPVDQYRDRPDLAPIAARASMTALQQLQAAQNDRDYELALKKFDQTVSSGPKRSLQPIYGTDQQGNPVLLQVGDDGSAIQTAMPEGVNLSTGVDRVDLGTQWGLLDKRSGQMVGTLPKDLAGAEAEKFRGKDEGEARALYDSMQSKMPGLRDTVERLEELTDRATYTWAGRALDEGRKQLGMEPRDEAIARAKYTAIIDNQILPLLRDTFGAQFTEREGDRLRSTLGDPNKSPDEKKALLKAFIEQKERDIEGLARRLNDGGSATGAPSMSRRTLNGVTYERDENGDWYQVE